MSTCLPRESARDQADEDSTADGPTDRGRLGRAKQALQTARPRMSVLGGRPAGEF